MTDFIIQWHAGASAQLELFSPQSDAAGLYQLKYTSAFRSTIRPPVQECNLTPADLQPIDTDLDALMTTLSARSASSATTLPPTGAATLLQQMEKIGGMLGSLTVPPYVMSDLSRASVFLELGVDEKIVAYPWELMHDGDEFLCLKHDMGRFVNASSAARQLQHATRRERLSKLSVLLIAVARPTRSGVTYAPLDSVDAEATAIADLLSSNSDVSLDLLRGRDATFEAVYDKSRRSQYDVIHYCGHAEFAPNNPRTSRLILQNRDMNAAAVVSFFSQAKPLLCFFNGCETARGATGTDRLSAYGIGQALLDTGAYVLATRWKVDETTAAGFAREFYAQFFAGKPLGAAVRTARLEARKHAPDELGWASYVLYGDPRLSIQREAT